MSIVIFVLMLALGVLGSVLGWWIDEAGDVVKEEFGPKAALEKYEWFVYQANAIAKADSDIALFEQRLVDIETQYTSTYGEDKTKWMPSTQAQYNHEMQIARDDLMAIVSNRNGLVKDYNTESQKFNWAPFKGRADYPPESFLDYKVH
ncbi:MAG: hypothetical protein UW88_C0008G0002 [Candidatus Collierbacteria bacterium GW2011_GWD2_45_10]|nr:MAG: hypothetical protein UW31_C0013G0002 [Candidatus Collierbacteria bacterium GW2011_GWA2_44_13]KKT62479.1 MAG: hypothetical protein UW56_C0006G0002 [Candidatus Collierbacteria bacterium GW2011_GWD1_44_27]KKT88728.1 MAG: hypothetical protein UW88_C0008G0002 [Candidatus Collierbacteria bacterium GW2011_GWD2_45_10]